MSANLVERLPRRLAIRLLHLAQCAGEQGVSTLVTAPAADGIPDRLQPLYGTNDRTMGGSAVPWAVFRYRPEAPAVPEASELGARPGLLLLTASLATRGVLQLHAWRCENGRVREVSLRIAD